MSALPFPQVQQALDAGELGRLWRSLLDEAPTEERFELTEQGELVLSPRPTNQHQLIVRRVQAQLEQALGGLALSEVAVFTAIGVRVPDVAWIAQAMESLMRVESPLSACPPLVVEVLSPGNRTREIDRKIAAYLQAGASEVIVVGLDGQIGYWRPDGRHDDSCMGVRLRLPHDLFR